MRLNDHLARTIRYPMDVFRIRKEIPLLVHLNDQTVQTLWEEFSRIVYCAGWLEFSHEHIDEFKKFLFQRVEEPRL